MTTTGSRSGKADDSLVIALPLTGRWVTQNSPVNRIPSHGTNRFGTRYAIDFVAVDDRGRTAPVSDWRTWFGTEPPERFHAFGMPLSAPARGKVVDLHDGEPDHEARRSQLALISYMLGQGSRTRRGSVGVAGNYIVLALPENLGHIAVVHLKNGSLRVKVGDQVNAGDVMAECGNSGNSTQPHVHLQASSSADFTTAQGLPVVFNSFTQWSPNGKHPTTRRHAMPPNGAIVEATI